LANADRHATVPYRQRSRATQRFAVQVGEAPPHAVGAEVTTALQVPTPRAERGSAAVNTPLAELTPLAALTQRLPTFRWTAIETPLERQGTIPHAQGRVPVTTLSGQVKLANAGLGLSAAMSAAVSRPGVR